MAASIIVSGDGDCRLNRDRLILTGVPRSAITLECQSRNTKENAEFTARLLKARGVKRAIIVTSWYHSRRALSCFRFFAPEIVFFSAPGCHELNRSPKPDVTEAVPVLEEYVRILRYAVLYRIMPWSSESKSRQGPV
jgi:uncharacterized SAM-binding protein YcdF (DUF218 family)